MDIQFEITKIESYSRALAEKISNEFFNVNEAIRGEQIVKLTPIDQVNLFVLKNLFSKWREESSKLKSPYFNYENQDVKEALQNVLNKLSQNIYIRREFFKPLLEKAIFDTLHILLHPAGYFKDEFGNRNDLLIAELKETEKFYKHYKTIIDQSIERAEGEGRSVLKGSELVLQSAALLPGVLITSQEREQILEQFSSLLNLEFTSSPSPIQPPKEEVRIEEPKKTEEVKPAPVEEKSNVNPTILNEKFGAEQRTVNDLLKRDQATLAEKISKSRIENIRGAISLSQKFLFINALFKGQSAEYEKALSEIDQCQNYDQALAMLNDHYAAKYRWDFNQYEVKEFVEIVERKFS